MKRSIILVAGIVMAILSTVNAQINLVGTATSQSGGVNIITWNALDSSSMQVHPTELTGYYLTSSVFDAYNGTYYISGLTETTQGLFSFNTKTLEQNLAEFSNFSNITEIDMSTGKIYNISADSLEYFSINEYDIETGADSLLGVIYEPGTSGIIVDAIAFNSNDGILYYLGYDSLSNLLLYSIPVREDQFSYSTLIIDGGGYYSSFFSLQYDNVNNTIHAISLDFDPMGNFTGNRMVEINPATGAVSTESELDEFMGFVMGSACFDQNTGCYLVIAIDTNYAWKMIVYNTYADSYITGWAPPEVSEIVCDNTVFATDTYITTSVAEPSARTSFRIYPNPAETTIYLTDHADLQGEIAFSVYDITGKMQMSHDFRPEEEIKLDISGLSSGVYFIQAKSETSTATARFIKQ